MCAFLLAIECNPKLFIQKNIVEKIFLTVLVVAYKYDALNLHLLLYYFVLVGRGPKNQQLWGKIIPKFGKTLYGKITHPANF
jgi:hypothetical protein